MHENVSLSENAAAHGREPGKRGHRPGSARLPAPRQRELARAASAAASRNAVGADSRESRRHPARIGAQERRKMARPGPAWSRLSPQQERDVRELVGQVAGLRDEADPNFQLCLHFAWSNFRCGAPGRGQEGLAGGGHGPAPGCGQSRSSRHGVTEPPNTASDTVSGFVPLRYLDEVRASVFLHGRCKLVPS